MRNKWKYAKPYRHNMSLYKTVALYLAVILLLAPWGDPLAEADIYGDSLLLNPNGKIVTEKLAAVEAGMEELGRAIALEAPEGCPVVEIGSFGELLELSRQVAAGEYDPSPAPDSGAEDNGAEDNGAQDNGAQDSGAEDSGAEDSGAQDSGAEDSDAQDSGAQDSGAQDSGAQDSDAQDNDAQDNSGSADSQDSGPPPAHRPTVFVRLTADIELAQLSDSGDALALSWLSIGTREHPFTGIFDGGGHTISGLDLHLSQGGTVFGSIENAVIANLKVTAAPVFQLDYEGLPATLIYEEARGEVIVNCVSAAPQTAEAFSDLAYRNQEPPDVSWFYNEVEAARAGQLDEFIQGASQAGPPPAADSGASPFALRPSAAGETPVPNTGWYDQNPDGTVYTVCEAKDVAGIAVLTNTGVTQFRNKVILITGDIDFGGQKLDPIGMMEQKDFEGEDIRPAHVGFMGRLVGYNGYNDKTMSFNPTDALIAPSSPIPPVELKNFEIEGSYFTTGFIGFLNCGIVENLVFKDCRVKGSSHVGMVTGYNALGVVNRCAVLGGTVSGVGSVGSLAGHSVNPLSTPNPTPPSYAEVSVSFPDGDGRSSTAGNKFDLGRSPPYPYVFRYYRCFSTATVTGATSVGGLVGFLGSNSSRNGLAECFFSGQVIGENAVGGIVGALGNAQDMTNIIRCASSGSVSASAQAGGIVGLQSGTKPGHPKTLIADCYSNAVISGYENVGGICGKAGTISIRRCYFTGSITSNVVTPTGTVQPILGSGTHTLDPEDGRNSVAGKRLNYAGKGVILNAKDEDDDNKVSWAGYSNSGFTHMFAAGQLGSDLYSTSWKGASGLTFDANGYPTSGNYPQLNSFVSTGKNSIFQTAFDTFSKLSTLVDMAIPATLYMYKPEPQNPDQELDYVFTTTNPLAPPPPPEAPPLPPPEEFVYYVPAGITGWGYYSADTGQEIYSFGEEDTIAKPHASGPRELFDPTLKGGKNYFTVDQVLEDLNFGGKTTIRVSWAHPFMQDTTFLLKTYSVVQGMSLTYRVTVKDSALRLLEDRDHMPASLLPDPEPGELGPTEMGLYENTLYFRFPEAVNATTAAAPTVELQWRSRDSTEEWQPLPGSASCSVQGETTVRVTLAPGTLAAGREYQLTLRAQDMAGNVFHKSYTGVTPRDNPPSISFDPDAYGAYETGEVWLETNHPDLVNERQPSSTSVKDPPKISDTEKTGYTKVDYQKIYVDWNDDTYAQLYTQGVKVTDDRPLSLSPTYTDAAGATKHLIQLFYIQRKDSAHAVGLDDISQHCGMFRVVYKARDASGNVSNYLVRDYEVAEPPQVRIRVPNADTLPDDALPTGGVLLDVKDLGVNMTDDQMLRIAFTMGELIAGGKNRNEALALALTGAFTAHYGEDYRFWFTGTDGHVRRLWPKVDTDTQGQAFREFVLGNGKLTGASYTLYQDAAMTIPLTEPYPGTVEDGRDWEYVNIPFVSNSGRTQSVSDLFYITSSHNMLVIDRADFVSTQAVCDALAPKVTYKMTVNGVKQPFSLPETAFTGSWTGSIDPASQSTQKLTWTASDILGLGFNLSRTYSVIVSDQNIEVEEPDEPEDKDEGHDRAEPDDRGFWEQMAGLIDAADAGGQVRVSVPYSQRYVPAWVMEALAEHGDVTLTMNLWDGVSVSLHSSDVDLTAKTPSRTVYDVSIEAMQNIWVKRSMMSTGQHMQQFYVAAKSGRGSRYYSSVELTLPLDDALQGAGELRLYGYDSVTHRYHDLGALSGEGSEPGGPKVEDGHITFRLPNCSYTEFVIAEPLPQRLILE